MACTELYDKILKKLLKMSMIPVPCQEHYLSQDGCVRVENIEWVLDLNDKVPIWSRLNAINTSGYNRKLPMSMSINYDIEIKGRLWSLWGHAEKPMVLKKKSSLMGKSYLASTVLGLCAARVFRLNIWNSQLMDCIAINGRTFFKKSLEQFRGKKSAFQLEDLGKNCTLEGLNFKICMETVLKGCLYSNPYHDCMNLAFALINFLANYQFGLLECSNRILGFGFIPGSKGDYFMFDAQSMNYPLFHKNTTAPYILRTNHLQILLYCLVVALNVNKMEAKFSIHNVQIDIISPDIPKSARDPTTGNVMQCKRILPNECWDIPLTASSDTSINLFDFISQTKQLANCIQPQPEHVYEPKYRRKTYNITKDNVENSIIKPIIDVDCGYNESLNESSDFLKIICSETVVPLTKADEINKCKKLFAVELNEAFVLGPQNCELCTL